MSRTFPHPRATDPPAPARPTRPGPLTAAGRACYRHRWTTLLAWLAGVAALIVAWQAYGAAADDTFTGSDPGQALLAQHFPRSSGDTLTLAVRSDAPLRSATARARVTSALAPFQHAAHVTSVTSPYHAPGQISSGGHIAFATVQFSVPSAKIPGGEVTALMRDATAASGHGMTFSLGGDVVDTAETPYGGPSEGAGVLAAAIVLLIAFGSLLAMGLPILTALLGIGAGLSLIALVGHLVPAPSFSPIVATMIGLGVGVDYALFIVSRFREALRAGEAPAAATVTAMRTAGRSVLIAGTTVVIAMLGLLVLRQPLLNGVAAAAALTVAMVMLASLTLLPALLGFTGGRLGKPSRLTRVFRRPRATPPGTTAPVAVSSVAASSVAASSGGSSPGGTSPGGTSRRAGSAPPAAQRWAAVIQRRPLVAALVSAGVILVLAAPALGMKLAMPDESSQPRGSMGYAAYATMSRGFGPGYNAPLIVVAHLPSPGAPATKLATALRSTPGVVGVTPAVVSRDRQAAMMIAYPATSEQDPATNALVNRLRDQVLPAAEAGTGVRAYLTGPNAGSVDFADMAGQRLPWLVGVVVLLSMMLLTAMFRSVTIAVKAAVMNLLSVGAAFGVLAGVVQYGWGSKLLGFPESMPVITWVPIFLFVILFGLSMDYEVFLLSRIREHYDATGDNAAAVAHGLARTARVITAAAAIMIVVFLSFVLGADVGVKQIGLGLAAAVLIDATLVRMVLVPAVMELLGKANWWLPRPLARVLPASLPREGEPLADPEQVDRAPAPAR
jgi:putative drug exporter of the RND superfamily